MKQLTLALALSFVLAPSARADLAPPSAEMLDCPRGAMGTMPPVPAGAMDPRGRPLRPWPYCAPTSCTTDADCAGGRVCSAEEVGLCVEDHEVVEGTTVRAARDRGCEPDGTCLNLQSACERARRCVPAGSTAPTPAVPPPPPPPPPSSATPAPAPAPEPETSAWGCHVGAPASPPVWAIAFSLALLGLRRRSRSSQA